MASAQAGILAVPSLAITGLPTLAGRCARRRAKALVLAPHRNGGQRWS